MIVGTILDGLLVAAFIAACCGLLHLIDRPPDFD